MKYHVIKRRYFGKGAHIFKRIILPCVFLYFLFYVFSSSPDRDLTIPEDNFIVPGEALDPLVKKDGVSNFKEKTDHKPIQNEKNVDPASKILVKNKRKFEKVQEHKSKPVKPFSVVQSPEKVEIHHEAKTMEGKESSRNRVPISSYDDSDVPQRMETSWSMAKANIPDMEKVRFKAHAINNDTVTLTLMSSADKVFISINKKQIYRGINQRGMHVVVLNQYSGRVMAKRVFDTFQNGVEEDMVDFISDVTSGRIIVFAVLDEVSSGLTWKGRNALKELGSRFSSKIGYRDMWAMVTRKDGLKIAETFSNVATADTGYEWGGPIFMRTDFDLEEKPVECQWTYNERNQARRMFCIRFEGYGDLCNCEIDRWEDIFFRVNDDEKLKKELSSKRLYNDLAVIVLASNKPHYLYRTLKSLYEAPGLNKDMIAIYAETPSREVTSLAKLFGISLVETTKFQGVSTPVAIRHKMIRIFRDIVGAKFDPVKVPEGALPDGVIPPFAANNVFVVEEDLVVSIDVFKYLYAVYPALERDESVLGISAFNYHSYRDVVDSQIRSYRTSAAQNLALVLPARTVHDVLVPNWPSLDDKMNEWYRGLEIAMKGEKDIIHPEISRAKHSSYEGYLVSGQVQELYFKDHMISLTTEYDIPQEEIDRLLLNEYSEGVRRSVKESTELTFDFCTYDLEYGHSENVIYVNYEEGNETSWSYLMKCLKTWWIYSVGGWRGVWQFHFHGHPLTIVGFPGSPFSSYKSGDYKVVTAPANFTSTTTADKATTKGSMKT